jgi:hypothetical protein
VFARYFCSGVTTRQILGNFSRSSRQLGEPGSKVQSRRSNVSWAGVPILHHNFLPLIIRVVKVIELLDHDSVPTSAVMRCDIVAIHVIADPAAT